MPRVSGTSKFSVLLSALALVAPTFGMLSIGSPAGAAVIGAYNLDQCANGGGNSTATTCVGGWVNGNLNGTKAHFAEGDSVPYRAKLSGLTALGQYKLTIEWDVTQGTAHALDYLTTYNRTVTGADACTGVTGCTSATATTYPIPKDTVTPAPANEVNGVFTMFGARIDGTTAYTHSGEKTSIGILFTTLTGGLTNPVLAWGGHIASRLDWGPGTSAGTINGSPYHMRGIELSDPNGGTGGGNQDLPLASDAVIAPATLTVVKVAAPKGAQTFQFTTTGLSPTSFSLADDGDTSPPFDRQVIGDIRDFTNSKTITETALPGWTLAAATCTGLSTWSKSGNSVATTLKEAEDGICTFSNVKNPTILTTKDADPTSIDEPGGPVKFTVSVKNESAVEQVTLTALNDVPYGNIAVKGGKVLDTTCVVPQTINAGATYTCSFHAAVTGDATSTITDVVTATAKDARNNTLTDDDDAAVTIKDVKPLLQVDKSVTPSVLAEPGGNVNFTVTVTNPSKEELTLTTLNDDKFGALSGKGNCAVPQKIAPNNGRYTCTFPASLKGDPKTPHIDVVTGTATDNENNSVTDTGTATVTFTDVVPTLVVDKSASPSEILEPGGKIKFTVVVTNPQGAAEHIDLTALRDDKFGNLDGIGTCDVTPAVDLAPGGNYTCSFEKDLTGDFPDTHVDTVTATVTDDDNNTVTGKDDAIVKFLDAKPSIEVEKTANPTSVPEPGGNVTFTVKVINPAGAAEPVKITSLIDDVYGNLAGKGSCLVSAPLDLAPGGSYTCAFTEFVGGQAREVKKDTIVGQAREDEGNIAEDSASATVTIDDVFPTLAVAKTADPTSVPETGGLVTFTVRVTNPAATGVENIFLSELTDSVYGDLNGKGTCDVTPAVTLAVGKDYVCTFTATVKGDFPEVHKDTVTAAAADDEKNRVTASDDADVKLDDVIPTILVDKAALPGNLPEPGGNVTYSVAVTNTSLETVTLTQLVDDTGAGPVSLAGKGDCLKDQPVTIEPGKTYACTFIAPVSGEARSVHTDTVTATAEDDEKNPVTGHDSATVTLTDVPPAIVVDKGAAPSEIGEPGGSVNFTVVVNNTSLADAVTLTSLVDNIYGDLNGKGTCDLAKAGTIPIGGHYSCIFAGPVSGNAGSSHDDTVTAVAKDNDGTSSPPATDEATVTILNVAPDIVVDKLAFPSQVNEPGGTVNFTVTVSNPGTAEDLTLDSLNDDVYGDLNGKGDCKVPQTIAKAGGSYTCTFPGEVKGDARSTHTDTVTAVAKDDDGSQVSDDAEATVTVVDVPPAVLVAKAATPSILPEPGGTATFTVTVTNPANAVESIKLTNLVDSVYGNLNGKGDCDVPQDLAPGAHYMCSFTGPVTGNGNSTHTDEVTATATDNETNTATDKATAEVRVSDVLPGIKIDKTAGASAVHAGDAVTYTYAVHNLGIEPLRDVTATDDKCSPLQRTGGDADGDELLDLTETWIYSCTTKLTGTTTNIVTGSGKDDEGNTATDTDTVTVNVVNPKIIIDKVADLTEVTAGDSVTYSYTVTNPGNAPLADVGVSDDKCGPVTLSGGDTDDDTLLDQGETWKFTCTATLSSPGQITNTGTVKGKDPIGGEVIATDTAVVSVLEVRVLPAVETQPLTLVPGVVPAPAPQPTLPVTGRDLLRWAASGLALIAGGSLLRRRRKP